MLLALNAWFAVLVAKNSQISAVFGCTTTQTQPILADNIISHRL